MFIKKTYSKNFVYLSLVESYRKNGKVKHRIITKLGRLDFLKENNRLQQMASILDKYSDNPSFRILDMFEEFRFNWGAERIYREIWRRLKFDEILDQIFINTRIKFDFKEVIFLEILSRLIDPCSKQKLHKKQKKFYGIKETSLHNLYRILDYLSDFQVNIEEALLKKRKKRNIDVVFYDVTTLYFESVKSDELKNFGYSKDCKFGEVQIVIGLLVEEKGYPISCGIFPGNTFEGKTLEDTLKKLKKKLNFKNVTIVADRGINSKINLKKIKDNGYEYIVSCKIKNMKKNIKKEILDLDKYEILEKENNIISLKYREIEYKNIFIEKGKKIVLKEKMFCTWSLKRAEKDRKDRERLIEKAKNALKNNSTENKRGINRYIKKEKQQAFLDVDKILEDAKWDGFYAIQASDKRITKDKVLKSYHRLWKIEESFRIMKSSLEIRPMFHWSPKRVRGHIVLCFLSFLFYRTLELILSKKGVTCSPEKIKEAINELEASRIKVKDQEYYMRANFNSLAKNILKTLKIPVPKPMCLKKNFY